MNTRVRIALGLAMIAFLLVGGAAVGIFPYTIGGITDGQVLAWNATSKRFEPATGGGGSGNVTNNGTLTDGIPIVGNGTTVVKSGAINLAGGASYVTGSLPVTNLGAITLGDTTMAAGSGNIVLNTVNSNVGTFGDSTHVAAVVLNGKGLATAGSNVAIRAAVADGATTGIASFVAANFTATAGVIDLANTTVTNGAVGNNTTWVYGTIDSKGRWTASGNVTLLGTANQITITGGTNNVTVSIASSATLPGSPTVAGTASTSAGGIVTVDGTQTLTNKTLTSATLTTPALGTPASGNLTNTSGYPAASVVTGALADGMTAATKSVNSNDTKLATTAYADRAAVVGNAPNALGSITGTVNIDWSVSQVVSGTLIGNVTFTFSNASSGQTILVDVAQTGTNTFTVTWPTMKWPAAITPTMTSGVAASDAYTIYDLAGTYKGSAVQNIQ